MGALVSRATAIFDVLGKKEYRIVMVGLDNAGKTTTLYKMKLGEVVNTIPTIGFSMETVTYRGVTLNTWDTGGQTKLRRLWHHIYHGTHAVIFVVDSSDWSRFEEASEELHGLLKEADLVGCKLLVLANKQDLPTASTIPKMTEALGLHSIRGHEWYIQPCSATTGQGLSDGLDWLVHSLKATKTR